MKKYIEIGSRLRELRGNLSQKDFAVKIEVSFRAYQNYELGERVPPSPVLSRIAEVCGVTIDYILTGDEESLRKYTLKEVQKLKSESAVFIERLHTGLRDIDPMLEQLFLKWDSLSKEDVKDVLQYIFYKKKVERLFKDGNNNVKEGVA